MWKWKFHLIMIQRVGSYLAAFLIWNPGICSLAASTYQHYLGRTLADCNVPTEHYSLISWNNNNQSWALLKDHWFWSKKTFILKSSFPAWQDWAKFHYFGKNFLSLKQLFEGLFSIEKQIEPTLAKHFTFDQILIVVNVKLLIV